MIITQLDAKYSPWLDMFLQSLLLTNPDCRVYVELVNFHPALAQYFRETFSSVYFADVALDNPSKHDLAHRKVDAGLAGFAGHPDEGWYLVCDVDILFRAPLTALIDSLRTHDAGVVFRDGIWEGVRYEYLLVACGFVAFKDTRLLGVWKRKLLEPSCLEYDRSSWYYDQITLLSATREVPLDYLHITQDRFLNREFGDHAIVWSAHMEPKELMYLKFREELSRLKGL